MVKGRKWIEKIAVIWN